MPLRPVLAAFSAPSYRLAKFILPGFNPFIENEYTLRNSNDFKDILQDTTFPNATFLTSFDVTSLFTNIPIKETLETAVELLYQNANSFRSMTKKDFGRILEICTEDNHFPFNSEHIRTKVLLWATLLAQPCLIYFYHIMNKTDLENVHQFLSHYYTRDTLMIVFFFGI